MIFAAWIREVRPRLGRPRFRNGGRSYRDPAYGQVEASLERQYGVPRNILMAVRTRGERSNADQVSEAGARTVYQIIPETRAAIQQRHGFDPWASPENAARGAAVLLAESFRRTGDWNRAVTEYHGGTNPRNWGARTRAYSRRVGRVGP